MQTILTSIGEISVDQLAVFTDKIMEVAIWDSRPTIGNVVEAVSVSEVADFRQMVANLTHKIDQMSKQVQSRSIFVDRDNTAQYCGSELRQRFRFTIRSRITYDPICGQCWCHWKFKEKARICISPRNFGTQTTRPALN